MKSDVINYLKDCRYVQVSTTILERKPKQTMKKTTSGRSKKQELKMQTGKTRSPWSSQSIQIIKHDDRPSSSFPTDRSLEN
jgi:hypothetical protein